MGGALRGVRGQTSTDLKRRTVEEDHVRVRVEDSHRFLLGDGTRVVKWGWGGVSHELKRHQCDRQLGGRGHTDTRDSQDVHRHADRQEMHMAALTPATREMKPPAATVFTTMVLVCFFLHCIAVYTLIALPRRCHPG